MFRQSAIYCCLMYIDKRETENKISVESDINRLVTGDISVQQMNWEIIPHTLASNIFAVLLCGKEFGHKQTVQVNFKRCSETSRYSSRGGRSNPLRFQCVAISQSHFLRHGISASRGTPNRHSLLPPGLSVGRDVVPRLAESLSLSSLSGVLEVRRQFTD